MSSLGDFAAFVEETRAHWEIPGVAVAVVGPAAGGGTETLFLAGSGLADVAGDRPVAEDTLFKAASVTKAFTATLLGTLVDEGRLRWDTPVRDLIPGFRLHDPVATARTTVRDLLSHQTGLPRHDLMGYRSEASRPELLGRLRHLWPSRDFRSFMQYQNFMFLVAGLVAETLLQSSWEEALQARVLEPLGMADSNLHYRALAESPRRATPYWQAGDGLQPLGYDEGDNTGPAGSLNTSIRDLARWVQFNLGDGSPLLQPGTLAELHAPQMVIRDMPGLSWFTQQPELTPMSYGLGWFQYGYRGDAVIHHGGNMDGFSSQVAFMPARGIGVAILTNLHRNMAVEAITFEAFDRLRGLPSADWNRRIKGWVDEVRAEGREGVAAFKARAVPDTRPSRELAAFAGRYAHPGYGELTVEASADGLLLGYNSLRLPLTHYHFDIFTAEYPLYDILLLLRFESGPDGRVGRALLRGEPDVGDIVFSRSAPEEAT